MLRSAHALEPVPTGGAFIEQWHETRGKAKMWWAILITAVLASFLTLVVLNLRAGEKHIRYQLTHRFSVDDPQFLRCMGQLLGPGILPGNRITALHNGHQIFPAMLEAIRGARETITFETYIYWSGEIGRKLSEAFCERARAGVKIHVMLDWQGSGKIEAKYLEDLKAAGVEVELYHPLHWYNLTRINNRTHRKLLVVDGRIGFTGGVGIADQWLGQGESKDHWRDSHYQIEGPAVAQMQAAFTDNWIKVRAQVLFSSNYFPELTTASESLAQVFKSSAGGGSESVRLMYLLSIASASKSICLQAAYFVPDELARLPDYRRVCLPLINFNHHNSNKEPLCITTSKNSCTPFASAPRILASATCCWNNSAEARAKIVYERLINVCDDPGTKDALQFLMTREITHLKAFMAALGSLGKDPLVIGQIPPTSGIVEQFYNDSTGQGDNGDIDARGPWNEGNGVKFIASVAQPIAAATEVEVSREMHNAVRRAPAGSAKPSRSKLARYRPGKIQ
jgi:hypothetical protein